MFASGAIFAYVAFAIVATVVFKPHVSGALDRLARRRLERPREDDYYETLRSPSRAKALASGGRACPRDNCDAVNRPTARYCAMCGRSLTEDGD
ncbi:MAG TPA: hypothetical protein P5081_18805 [Phycisphaerae bacterium]|nr:hypothetical protein [Phycisphaerae bacterium]HRW54923.1 hypothetical protein [Phycisphaerae bacterium]